MHLSEGFVVHDVGGSKVLISLRRDAPRYVVESNASAGDIFELLQEDMTQEEIVDAMYSRYDAPREKLAKDVLRIIAKLTEIGAIAV